MKAFLLAAGVGSRLRPVTDSLPKCMLSFGGRPLLDIWLDELARVGVDEVLVNLHHLPQVVALHISGRDALPKVRVSFEPELLGSAGTLHANSEWVAGETLFLACYADNLTDFDLRVLVDAHQLNGSIATLAAFHSENPSAGGVIEVDASGMMISFAEKPAEPLSDLTNAGIYVFDPEVLNMIQGRPPLDIGYDLLPRLVGSAHVVPVDAYFRDIGTPEAYRRALEEWPALAAR